MELVKIETVQVETPQVSPTIQSQDSQEGPHGHGRKQIVNCAICDIQYEADKSFPITSMNEEEEDGTNFAHQMALRAEIVRTLCLHLNVSEFLDSSNGNDMDGNPNTASLLMRAFHLCPICHDSANKLVSINRRLKLLLADIDSIVESFRTSMAKSEGKNLKRACHLSVEDERYSGRRFRNLVLQNGPGSSILMEPSGLVVEQERFETKTDFACLESVISVSSCGSQLEVTYPNDVDYCMGNTGNIKYENISAPISPSPAFSPISFENETEAFPQSISQVEQVIQDQDSQVETVPELKKRSIDQVFKGHRKKLSKRKHNEKLNPKKSASADKDKLNRLPKCDRTGFKAMLKMGIPFKRLEVHLIRLGKNSKPFKNTRIPENRIRKTKNNKRPKDNPTVVQKKNREQLGKKSSKEFSLLTSASGSHKKSKLLYHSETARYSQSQDRQYLHSSTNISYKGQSQHKLSKKKSNKIHNRENVIKRTAASKPKRKDLNSVKENSAEENDQRVFICNRCDKKCSDATMTHICRKVAYESGKNSERHSNLSVKQSRVVRHQRIDGKIMVGDTELLVNDMGNYTCGTCGQTRNSERALINHVKETHAFHLPKNRESVQKSNRRSVGRNVVGRTPCPDSPETKEPPVLSRQDFMMSELSPSCSGNNSPPKLFPFDCMNGSQ